MRINNVLRWYRSNLSSQLNCTWQANPKEHISVWGDRQRVSLAEKERDLWGMYETGCSKQSRPDQMSHSAKDVREKSQSLCENQ